MKLLDQLDYVFSFFIFFFFPPFSDNRLVSQLMNQMSHNHLLTERIKISEQAIRYNLLPVDLAYNISQKQGMRTAQNVLEGRGMLTLLEIEWQREPTI